MNAEQECGTPFRFDRNYRNHDQVAPFLPRFLDVYAELERAGKYTYNDSFRGRIPGIEGPDEDSAIYMLQTLKRLVELDARIEAALAEGYERIESVPKITKFSRVVHYGFYMGGTGWQEWEDARLVPEERPQQVAVSGGIRAVLPKGKRTHGYSLSGGKVLVKR